MRQACPVMRSRHRLGAAETLLQQCRTVVSSSSQLATFRGVCVCVCVCVAPDFIFFTVRRDGKKSTTRNTVTVAGPPEKSCPRREREKVKGTHFG